MKASRSLLPVGVLAVALMATSCADEGSREADPTATTSPTDAVAYPPVNYSWDVVPGLDSSVMEAARFAAETDALSAQAFVDENAGRQHRGRIAPELDLSREEGRSRTYGGEITGGGLSRTVAVADAGDGGALTVTVCYYPTPGVYALERGGRLKLSSRSGPPWLVTSMRVTQTTEPAADGSTSPAPRWLQVPAHQDWSPQAQADRQALCGRYAPDPLVQTPPAPLPSK